MRSNGVLVTPHDGILPNGIYGLKVKQHGRWIYEAVDTMNTMSRHRPIRTARTSRLNRAFVDGLSQCLAIYMIL